MHYVMLTHNHTLTRDQSVNRTVVHTLAMPGSHLEMPLWMCFWQYKNKASNNTKITKVSAVKHWPAKLLDSADINDPVMKVVHKLWHVLVQKPLVCMHRVTWGKKKTKKSKTKHKITEGIKSIVASLFCCLFYKVTYQQGDIVLVGYVVSQRTQTHTLLVPEWLYCPVQPE